MSIFDSSIFEKTEQNGQVGYYDSQERVFIPRSSIPSLIQEVTRGPSRVVGFNADDYHLLCQVRIRRFLKGNAKIMRPYKQVFLRYIANKFLESNEGKEVELTVFYLDVVGSTVLSMNLPSERLTKLISIFCQEISYLISIYGGFVLKYVGDALISFFPTQVQSKRFAVLDCVLGIKQLLKHGINEILVEEGYEPISIRIGCETGPNKIVRVDDSLDILGYTMNITSKLTNLAKPDGICIGQKLFSMLDQEQKKSFEQVDANWNYKDNKGDLYKAYELI